MRGKNTLTRRAFVAELDRAWARFGRQGEPSAVLLLDLDRFKTINDTLVHAAGDTVPATVANCCGEQVRIGDAFGRIGGEEFVILLGNINPGEAAATAERFRSLIASLKIPSISALQITTSIGILSVTTDVPSLDAWLALADAACTLPSRAVGTAAVLQQIQCPMKAYSIAGPPT